MKLSGGGIALTTSLSLVKGLNHLATGDWYILYLIRPQRTILIPKNLVLQSIGFKDCITSIQQGDNFITLYGLATIPTMHRSHTFVLSCQDHNSLRPLYTSWWSNRNSWNCNTVDSKLCRSPLSNFSNFSGVFCKVNMLKILIDTNVKKLITLMYSYTAIH